MMLFIFFTFLLVTFSSQYQVPQPHFQVYKPKGFSVSIPNNDNSIEGFAFYGKINAELEDGRSEDFKGKITKPRHAQWTLQNRNISLKEGDALYYMLKVYKDGNEHTLKDVYIFEGISDYAPRTDEGHHVKRRQIDDGLLNTDENSSEDDSDEAVIDTRGGFGHSHRPHHHHRPGFYPHGHNQGHGYNHNGPPRGHNRGNGFGPNHGNGFGPHHGNGFGPHHGNGFGPHHGNGFGPHHGNGYGPHHGNNGFGPNHGNGFGPNHGHNNFPGHHHGSGYPSHGHGFYPHHHNGNHYPPHNPKPTEKPVNPPGPTFEPFIPTQPHKPFEPQQPHQPEKPHEPQKPFEPQEPHQPHNPFNPQEPFQPTSSPMKPGFPTAPPPNPFEPHNSHQENPLNPSQKPNGLPDCIKKFKTTKKPITAPIIATPKQPVYEVTENNEEVITSNPISSSTLMYDIDIRFKEEKH